MFEAKTLMFIYVETPLHAGSGRGLGAVDLPIQRERVTHYPIIQSSGVKGKIRAEVRQRNGWRDDSAEVTALFGKAGEEGASAAGAIAPGDARVLLFPVRSLAGVFAWTTSLHALARFQRECALVGLNFPWLDGLSEPPEDPATALIGINSALKAGESVVLEEFSFRPQPNEAVARIGEWIAQHALPPEYTYWQQELPRKLIILPEDYFRDFITHGTEVQTHVRLDPDKKTVQTGALWTTESLPVDTLLYAPLMATRSRVDGTKWSAGDVLNVLRETLHGQRVQFGGDETTGQGWTTVTLAGGGQ
ncbi:MAG: type III-B CRISPR module RAMP protein Cmr4 [Candidatus Roseilinea sp.]|nr:MAG: type III-B CRISPR module RAMP protein Cmr4 [Candidatus Roseilinea sp.]